MTQLLQSNALESWAMAISFCDQIMDGKAILSNQKYFVSSLQNAIELFTKQHMLNKCDYRVVVFTKIDSSGEPLKSYLSSTNLNDYIKSCASSLKYKSIDFSRIIDCFDEIFAEFFSQHNNITSVKSVLKRLKQLRNDETHFFVDNVFFLKEADFISLYNLMVDFYQILRFYNLLPFFGKEHGKYNRLAFNRNLISSFSYKTQLEQSKFVIDLKKNIEDKVFPTHTRKDSYSITEDIMAFSEVYGKNDFDELWAYIEMLLKSNLLIITEHIEYEYVNGQQLESVNYRTYSVKI